METIKIKEIPIFSNLFLLLIIYLNYKAYNVGILDLEGLIYIEFFSVALGYLFMGTGQYYYIIGDETLEIKNSYFFWFEKSYNLSEIKEIKITTKVYNPYIIIINEDVYTSQFNYGKIMILFNAFKAKQININLDL